MQRRPHGFTLIELMVVIGIIVLMSTILLISTRAMTQGNSLAQAGNVLSAYLSNARALALQSGNYAGVALFEDPNNANQTAMRIIVSDGPAGTFNELISFTTARGYDIGYLPRDMDVAAIDGGSAFRFAGDGTTTATPWLQCRVVLFDANGRLVVRDGLTCPTYGAANTYNRGDLVVYTNGTDISCYVCQADGVSGVTPSANANVWHQERLGLFAQTGLTAYGRSSPALGIYDARAFADAQSASFPSTGGNPSLWLQQNGQIVAVNAYTGSLIK
jgi:prepilin-type N-terminal cleavage/methylation domain-containing protein